MPKQSFNVALNISAKGTKLPSKGRIRADFGNPDSGSETDSNARSSRAIPAVPPPRGPGFPPMFPRPYVSPPPPPPPPGWASLAKGQGDSESESGSGSNSDSESDSDSEAGLHGHSSSESESETKDKKRSKKKKKTSTKPIGSVAEIKNLYMSPKDRDGSYTWVSEPPQDLPEPGENSESDTYAILVRNIKTKGCARRKLQAQTIIIQSPHLKTALAEIFAEYPGISPTLKKVTFEAPFQQFVHRWPRFLDYMNNINAEDDATVEKVESAADKDTSRAVMKAHLTLLHDLLKQEIAENVEAMQDYVANGVVTFWHLWMFFEPGSVVLSSSTHKGQMTRAYELKSHAYQPGPNGGMCLFLNVDYVDYNGKIFGRYPCQLKIAEFEGTKKTTALEVYPLRYCEDREAVEGYLMERGKKFEELQGCHFREYNGLAYCWSRSENEISMQVNARVMVDAASFARFGEGAMDSHPGGGGPPLGRWTFKDMERFRKWREENGEQEHEDGKDGEYIGLTPYHRMLANSRTSGYELKSRKWLEFEVDYVGEVKFNPDVTSKLVLPDEQKELILAMAESQIEGTSGFDDVIKGKGKGVVCLLSGPPGVGKTLTAEVVAETLHAPLVSLGSGDLGCDAADIEECLLEHLELVARWKGILLIDECDVFLEARGKNDLVRNQIVSVFLRMLEYYEGLMFMTTNRIENIDAAFQSRIHVSFEYPDLNVDSRQKIWSKFIESAAECGFKVDVSEKSIRDLAELELNGRQIKNIVKTAQLLASRRKGKVLTRGIIETVLEIEKKRPSMGPISGASGEYEVLM
ncbi:AAA ATPase family protein [Naviculisporaceae sp. PSN 640]